MSNQVYQYTTNILFTALADSAMLAVSTFAMNQLPFVSWLNPPMTPHGLALCTAVDACTLTAANIADKIYNQQGKTTYRIAFNVAGLVGGLTLLSTFAKSLTARTGIYISTYATVQLIAFHGAIKTLVYTAYQLVKSSYTIKIIKNVEDVRAISIPELGRYKKQFELHQAETWDTFTLNMQAAFNLRLKQNGQNILPFTSLKTQGKLSQDELQLFLEFVGETPTADQARVLIMHDVPPPKGCTVLPQAAPHIVDVARLSPIELRWYHHALLKEPDDLSAAQFTAFANAFYKADLPQPNEKFLIHLLDLPLPITSDGITKTQADYYLNYFMQKQNEYHALEPKQQLVLNKIFAIAGEKFSWTITEPKQEDLAIQSKEVLEEISKQYDAQPELWTIKSIDYQKAFNAALEDYGLSPKQLTEYPWSTTKRVYVYGLVTLAILGLIVAPTAMLLMNRAVPLNTTLKDKPATCTEEHCSTII